LPLWAKKMKHQIIAVLGCGDILPFHLIYEGKMSHYLPNYDFREGFDITCNATHWSNETTMLWYLEKIVFPYVSEKRKKLGFLQTSLHHLFLKTLVDSVLLNC